MAITKIHAIKATVAGAVNYICNPEKTDSSILITSFATSPKTAAEDFRFTLSHTDLSDPNKAYHLIQSFAPGEVSAQEAHKIGNELADRLLGGRYSYIVSTHTDKGHIHNHLIFCAADNIDYKKYHDCKRSYWNIRHINDELCEEHNLSVIKENTHQSKSYKEWQTEKNGTSWKARLKADINECIRQSRTYEEFLTLMSAKGYEIDPRYLANIENSGQIPSIPVFYSLAKQCKLPIERYFSGVSSDDDDVDLQRLCHKLHLCDKALYPVI